MEQHRRQDNQLEFKTRPVVLDYEAFGLVESTGFEVEINGRTELLHHENTILWSFDDPRYRHIEWHPDDGQLAALQSIDNRLFEALEQAKFPRYYRPRPDRATYEWYVMSQCHSDQLDIAAYLGRAALQSTIDSDD